MLETKSSIDMINNINYHLDLGGKNNQRLKNFSNEQDVLPYHVYKQQLNKQASQKNRLV